MGEAQRVSPSGKYVPALLDHGGYPPSCAALTKGGSPGAAAAATAGGGRVAGAAAGGAGLKWDGR